MEYAYTAAAQLKIEDSLCSCMLRLFDNILKKTFPCDCSKNKTCGVQNPVPSCCGTNKTAATKPSAPNRTCACDGVARVMRSLDKPEPNIIWTKRINVDKIPRQHASSSALDVSQSVWEKRSASSRFTSHL